MEIAFERHATSKIRQASDLEVVKSMGFRGEALASIAAIANVEMVSKHKDSEIGNRIVIEAGKILEFEEAGCPKGTTITVKNLFFNTPVRYKFLKKDFTEAGYIEDVITRIALVNPDIAIKLINNGKVVIQTTGNGNLQDVIYSIYGKDIASSVLDVNYTFDDLKITGVIGKPEIARSNRGNQLFFVNKRYIKDKILTGATEKAFKGMIPIGKFGFVILNIEMEPSKVDVNVHPAKLEVRFEEENKVFKAIYHAIQETLMKAELIASPEKEVEDSKQAVEEIKQGHMFSNLFRTKFTKETKESFEETIKQPNIIEQMYNERNDFEKTQIINTEEIKEQLRKEEENIEKANLNVNAENREEIKEANISIGNILTDLAKMKAGIPEELNISADAYVQDNTEVNQKVQELNNLRVEENFDGMYKRAFGKIPPSTEEKIVEEKKRIDGYDLIKENNISVFEQVPEIKEKPVYKFIGIAFSTYIIIEINEEMYIIDQHAAHERIMYEKIKKNYYSRGEKESQMLLLPDIITLTHKEMDIARENMEIFRNAGFELQEFGENTIKLNGVPTVCYDLDTKELFLETLDEINSVARTAKQEIEERFIETVACKAAVKAKMSLNVQEVESLMDELLKLTNPFTCPHGRPTAIKMDKKDIEKKFARRK